MADIASPAEPVPPSSGQPASPVAPIVPGQYGSGTISTANIGLAPGIGAGDYTGDFTKNYFKDLYGRMGLTQYQATPESFYKNRTLPELADQFLGVRNEPAVQSVGMEGPRISGPTDLDFWLRPYSPGMRGASLQRALAGGFDEELGGAVMSWRAMQEAIGDTVEEGYDPFRDRQIADAGMTNQMSLFYGSQGREHTRWLISHIREKQREAQWAAGGSVVEQSLGFAGGILGDPSNLLPGNIGLKGVSILNRMRQGIATGNELRIIAAGRVAYGSLGDGLRTAGWQAGAMIASRALANQLDPTIPGDISADLILPSVIAGSLGVIQGVSARRAGRKLADQVHDPDFLKPTPPAPPEPRKSFLGSQVVDTVMARTKPASELVEKIPEPLKEKIKEEVKEQVKQAILGQTPPSNGGNFPPGALNTDYGPMRVHEHRTSAMAGGFTEEHVTAPALTHTKDFDEFAKGNKLFDMKGGPFLAYHGTTRTFTEHSNEALGSNTGAKSATMGHFFASNPKTSEAGYARFIEQPEMAIGWKRSTLAERIFQGKPVRQVTDVIPARVEGEGAQIRPTYLRMTNPYIVDDMVPRHLSAEDAFLMGTDETLADVNGQAWIHRTVNGEHKLVPVKEQLVFKEQGEAGTWQTVPDPDRKPVDSIMQSPEGRRQIVYADEIEHARRMGHDGVVIRQTKDGGMYDTDIYVVFDPKTQIRGFDQRYQVNLPTKEAKSVSPITANNHWLDEKGKPVTTTPGTSAGSTVESRKAMSEIFSKDEGMTRLSPHDLAPGMVGGKRGFEESLVITPDGQLWHLNQKSFDLAKQETDMPVGQHNILGIRYGDQTDSLVRVTTYGDEIAADAAKTGNTPQQTATLRRIENVWKREGMADKSRLGIDEAPKAAPEIAPDASEGAHQPGSVGAQLSPTSLAYQESVLLAQGRLVPTGIGLEKMPLNPIFRAFQGASVAAMRFVADLASTGGVITKANAEGIANLPPVEVLYQMNWNKRLVDTLRHQQDQWSAYRQKVAGVADTAPDAVNIEGRSDWKRTSEQLGTAIKDRIMPGEPGLSFEQFRIRVAEAQNKGDVDAVSDAATPYVNASAAKFRSDIYEHAKGRAIETGVFDEVYREALDQAHADIEAIKKEAKDMAVRSHVERWTPDQRRLAEEALMARQEDAEFKYAQQKKQLDNLRDHGPLLNGTAQSYRPRLWDTGKLLDDEQGFFDKVVPWFQSQAGGSLDLPEAVRITKQIHELLSHQNPIFDRGDMKALFQSVAGPTSAHARSFTIPDELVKDFLVNDSETLARYHTQQMGKAIEFKERFGSLDAKEQIAEIEQDYRRQIIEANQGATEPTELAKQLTAQMKTAIADAQALRDKFYGTYGASPDPHRWDSRTIRMAKQFNNLTMLGMSGISALGDLIRPVMTEGIDAVYGYGIRSLMSESRAIIMRMNKQELELEGNGMELALNVRAMAAADTGDVFGSRGKFEHGLNQANAWNFVLNGLNGVNQIDKEWARLSIGGRVNNILLDLAAEDLGGGALRLSETDRARFAAAGIDEVIGRRIGLQIKVHGRDFGNITMPNTTAWTDEYARDVYRSAMNQFVNRTVPTPGIGDRPNWASTEWGSLISQYKSFGMGSLIRGGISGLQEGGNRFWYGAAATVGFAILLNEVRSQLFYDKSTFDKPAPAVIVDGIDRSGILGWFSDINRAVETLSGHRLGVKPMMGAGGTPVTPTLPQVAGTLGGPTAGQAGRIVSVANDYMSGHPTAQTMRNWRALTPGGTNPVLDPAFDRLLPGSYPKRGSEPRAAPPQAGGG